jgi:hypothetical protein
MSLQDMAGIIVVFGRMAESPLTQLSLTGLFGPATDEDDRRMSRSSVKSRQMFRNEGD